MSKKIVATGTALIAVAMLSYTFVGRVCGEERHPHIHAALKELRECKTELKEAKHDFGGHREEAVKAVEAAIEQLEQAKKFDKQ